MIHEWIYEWGDYQPLIEEWTPPRKSPKPIIEIEFGQFQRLKWMDIGIIGARWLFAPSNKGAPWHILTQKNEDVAATLCGTVGHVVNYNIINSAEFNQEDYKRHTCIDCLNRYDNNVQAHDISFMKQPLTTFDDRNI